MKKCSKCKLEKNSCNFYPKSSWCKDCGREASRLHYYKNKEKNNKKAKLYSKTINGKFSKYKTKAKERNIIFSISFKEFKTFWNKPCFYCSNEIETISLDRIDNNLGYYYNNVVSCCIICNKLKNNQTIKDWNDYICQLKNFIRYKTLRKIEYNYKHKYNYGLNRQFKNYIYSASRRNFEFLISFEEFKSFLGKPCFYCGTITNVINLDRIDNSKGYIENNLVSCCKICNSGKGTLEFEKWIKHINDIMENYYESS